MRGLLGQGQLAAQWCHVTGIMESRDYVTVVSLYQGLRGSYNCYSVIVLRTTIQTYGYYSVGSALADNYRAQH